MKRVFIVGTALLFALIAWGMADHADAYTIYQLTDNEIDDGSAVPSISAGGQVAWIGDDQVFLSYGLEILQLTDDDNYYRRPQINDSGWVVWYSLEGIYAKVFLYDGCDVIQLNETFSPNYDPQINDTGQVVWEGHDGDDYEIFLYEGTVDPAPFTENDYWDGDPQINNSGQMAWRAYGMAENGNSSIYFYDGEEIVRLTDDERDYWNPKINNNGWVVWNGRGISPDDTEIFLYNGIETIQLTHNDYYDELPQINDAGQVVWYGCDGADCPNGDGDYEIFLYEGTVDPAPLTDNDYDDKQPQINNSGHVVWERVLNINSSEIFLYDGTEIVQLTDDDDVDSFPRINDRGWVVWSGHDGNDYEIYLAVPDPDGDGIPDIEDSCPDEDASGFDVDGDGCIDSAGGLEDIIATLVLEGVIDSDLENSLSVKLENAAKSADKDNICAAVNQLEALVNQVNAQRDTPLLEKKISDEAAEAIIAYVESVINYLMSQLPPGESC